MAKKGYKQSKEHKDKIAESIKERHKKGLQPLVVKCPKCQTFMGLNHNCDIIREKQKQSKIINPTKYWLGKNRDEKTRKAISEKQKGKEHKKGIENPCWTGSYYWYHKEARKIMENKIGRKLNRTEIVHHINGDWKDNNINNLQLVNRAEHINIHRKNFKF